MASVVVADEGDDEAGAGLSRAGDVDPVEVGAGWRVVAGVDVGLLVVESRVVAFADGATAPAAVEEGDGVGLADATGAAEAVTGASTSSGAVRAATTENLRKRMD